MQALLRKPVPDTGERCDFCAQPVGAEHGHLVDLKARRIMCGCRPCWLVFEPTGAAQGRYKPVPTRYAVLSDLLVDETTWDALQIPIGLAFFFYNSVENRVIALYPGPAGATESQLPLDAWSLLAAHPVVAGLEADVEALVLRRREGATAAYLVPIDRAYELVGVIRSSWRGFDGGEDAKRRIDAFFESVEARA
ncbi:MAG: hypothetical protein GIX03_12430 [Candidatus Eremiobacteraeota bacterium]|nr:hypothetical protein [Candidatus Eremiobacteraeota bacterium]MBC5803771.1 hypothetical protein [Candidatus Eremiobacteraeota bacterium]MBC5821843.1 hypothetical protein [Candidatus Eremiobacteraeota bacterium]